MARELNARDLKLVQYLNEAYGKEKQLETALTADISITTDKPYRKRLQEHLKETRDHARRLKSRIRAIGGRPEEVSVPGPEAVSDVASSAVSLANRAVAAAKGPAHMLRGTGEQEKLLKNAKTQYWNEFEEIATYTAIETLASTVGDKETAKIAREEIPAALRNGGPKSRSARSTKKSRKRTTKSRARSTARSTKKRARSAAKTARSTAKTARTSARAASTAAKRSRAGAKGGRKRTKSRSR